MVRYSFIVRDSHPLSRVGYPTLPINPLEKHRELRTPETATVPEVACGHTNHPFSGRFANKRNPSPSHLSNDRKDEDLPAERVLDELQLYERAQSVKSTSKSGKAK